MLERSNIWKEKFSWCPTDIDYCCPWNFTCPHGTPASPLCWLWVLCLGTRRWPAIGWYALSGFSFPLTAFGCIFTISIWTRNKGRSICFTVGTYFSSHWLSYIAFFLAWALQMWAVEESCFTVSFINLYQFYFLWVEAHNLVNSDL